MSHGTPQARWGRPTLWASVGALLLAILVAGGCSGEADSASDRADADPIHAHGLGVNPADSALYIATHTGLFRMDEGSDEAARVGDRRQDTMGFTVAGADRFLGSGHPDLREGLPPLLGLVESRDRGRSWEPVSLLGKADFHALRATGSFIHGYDASGGRLMISADGGETWTVGRPPPLSDLAVDPDDRSRLVASAESGLVASDDDGRSWRPLAGPPALLAWPRRDALYALTRAGGLRVSRDGGVTWTRLGSVGGAPEAITAPAPERLIVALEGGSFTSSSDGGRTWSDGAWAQ